MTVTARDRHTEGLISGDCVAVTLSTAPGAPDVVERGRFERADDDSVTYQHLGVIKTVDASGIRAVRRIAEREVAAAFRVGEGVVAHKHAVAYVGVITAIRGTRLQVAVTVAAGRRRSIDVAALHARSAEQHAFA